jgi:hypothetical protein
MQTLEQYEQELIDNFELLAAKFGRMIDELPFEGFCNMTLDNVYYIQFGEVLLEMNEVRILLDPEILKEWEASRRKVVIEQILKESD